MATVNPLSQDLTPPRTPPRNAGAGLRARLLCTLLTAAMVIGAVPPSAVASPEDLPDIGSPSAATLTPADEYMIGRMIVRGLRDQDQILEDPEVTEYIQGLGHRLSSQARNDGHPFEFFVVKDPAINAFALPGGFIGVNTGLILATKNESELAGVLAHEISHVTQKHISRSIAAESKNSIVSTAAMLAAILLGAAAGGGDGAMAGIAAAQSVSLAQRAAFTRANESEADQVGIGVLAQAGFDPNGMPDFFDTIGRRSGSGEARIPEIVRTHPVTSERIAEARARAALMEVPPQQDSPSYALSRERLRVLGTPAGENPASYYLATIRNPADASRAEQYGQALAQMNSGHAADASRVFQRLRDADPTVVQYHTALGQSLLLSNQGQKSLATYEHARELFPRNVPVTVRYAEALLRLDDAKRAHEVLLDLFNVVPPTPEQARLIAQAANAAGDVGDAYYYMSEYHIMGGDLPLAISQLQLALAVPKLTNVQRARFRARMEEVQEAMPRRPMRQQAAQQERRR